jgi:FecR protein
MRNIKTLAVIASLLSSGAAYAGSPGWTVSETSGAVAISRAGVTNASFNRIAAKGGKVGEGDIIATGANGRAVIVRGEEYVIVAPNSRLRIVDTTENNTLTQFFQSAGNSVFKIKKKMTPHFGVQTPYLAAVVKGTTFSVTVTPTGAAVQVTEGRVQVSTLDGAATHLVIPGEIGMVSQGMPYRLTVQGAEPQIIDSPNRGQLLPKPEAATGDDKAAPVDKPADTVASVDPIADAPKDSAPSRFDGTVVAAVTEGPVNLDTVTGGMVSGNSTLVSTISSTTTIASIAVEEPRPVGNPTLQPPIQVVATPDPVVADTVPNDTVVSLPPTPAPDLPQAPTVKPTGGPDVSPVLSVKPGIDPVVITPPTVVVVNNPDPISLPPSPAPDAVESVLVVPTPATPVDPAPVVLVTNTPDILTAPVDPAPVLVTTVVPDVLTPPTTSPDIFVAGNAPVTTQPTIDPNINVVSGGTSPSLQTLIDSGLVLLTSGNTFDPNVSGSPNSGPGNQQGNNQQGNNQQGSNQSGNTQINSNLLNLQGINQSGIN